MAFAVKGLKSNCRSVASDVKRLKNVCRSMAFAVKELENGCQSIVCVVKKLKMAASALAFKSCILAEIVQGMLTFSTLRAFRWQSKVALSLLFYEHPL